MWIKYTGEKPYISLELKKIKPKERRNVDPELAKRLIEKYPKWFKISKALTKDVIEVIKDVPKIIKGAFKNKSEEVKEEKEEINIEEVKKK